MKVALTREGKLRIITENETEEYALEKWRDSAMMWSGKDDEYRTYNPDYIEFKYVGDQ